MTDPIDDDEFTDVDDLLRWIGHARTEIRALRAERDALRARAEAAEAALATARAEGAAAERAAVVAFLHGGADTHAGIGSPAAAAVLRDHAAYIAIGAHVRPVEGA